jgi:hypothetical protein
MADNFQKIDGVGQAREESLISEGYEDFEDLAQADASELSNNISRLPEDSALEMIIQAQNLTELENASVTENPSIETGTETETETETENNTTSDEQITVSETRSQETGMTSEESENTMTENTGTDNGNTYTVTISIKSDRQYDALYDTLISYRQKLIRTNREGVSRADTYLDKLRVASVDSVIELSLSQDELNSLHNIIKQNRVNYQGKNYSEQLRGIREIEDEINTQRRELLF